MEYPQKAGLSTILSDAFRYWSRTLVFQLCFTIITFAVFLAVTYYAGVKYGVLEQYFNILERHRDDMVAFSNAYKKMVATENFQTFYWFILGTAVFLYPLNLGFYKIYRKLDMNEKLALNDLFAGYMGMNFFRYIGFFMFWIIIYTYTLPTFILPLVWVLVTLFCAPLMFFMDKTIFESISLTFKALKMFFLEIFVGVIVALLFKYVGIMTLIGGLFTYPFMNAMIYSLYKRVFNEKY